MVIDIFHAAEEFLIERDVVVQLGELRHEGLLCRSDFGSLIRLVDTEEDAGDAVQKFPAVLVSKDGVAECRRLFAVSDGVDSLALLGDGGFQSRQIVAGFDAAEVRSTKGQRARNEQWVGRLCCGGRILRHGQHD